jgi:hypothetical protein
MRSPRNPGSPSAEAACISPYAVILSRPPGQPGRGRLWPPGKGAGIWLAV